MTTSCSDLKRRGGMDQTGPTSSGQIHTPSSPGVWTSTSTDLNLDNHAFVQIDNRDIHALSIQYGLLHFANNRRRLYAHCYRIPTNCKRENPATYSDPTKAQESTHRRRRRNLGRGGRQRGKHRPSSSNKGDRGEGRGSRDSRMP